MTALTSDDREWKKTIKMLINILWSSGEGERGRGGRKGEEAVRCTPAPTAERNITLLTWKTKMMLCVNQCVVRMHDCMGVHVAQHKVTVGQDDGRFSRAAVGRKVA